MTKQNAVNTKVSIDLFAVDKPRELLQPCILESSVLVVLQLCWEYVAIARTENIVEKMVIPVKSTDFGGSLPIFLPFLPSYRQPTDLPQSTDFYRFFRGSTEF